MVRNVEIDTKSALMQVSAEVEEDEWLDDGEIEIPSDEEYNGLISRCAALQLNELHNSFCDQTRSTLQTSPTPL